VPRFSFLKRGLERQHRFRLPAAVPVQLRRGADAPGTRGRSPSTHLCSGRDCGLGTAPASQGVGVAVTLMDRGMSDDKLVLQRGSAPARQTSRRCCASSTSTPDARGLLNLWRRRPGRNACEGWCTATEALARARPLTDAWTRADRGRSDPHSAQLPAARDVRICGLLRQPAARR
jgi:inorganic pyrophosphatase